MIQNIYSTNDRTIYILIGACPVNALKQTKPATQNRRDSILDLAMDVASSEGLEGLTIGRLAKLADMSKSGLFAHFGSKEDLQLATVHHAKKVFREQVWHQVSDVDAGILRLRFMLRRWIDYIDGCGLQGGCFFAAAAAEFDGRPGGVRDRLVKMIKSWVTYLEEEVGNAIELSQIQGDADPARITFELHALVQEANLYRQLFDRRDAFDLARASVDARLLSASTESGRSLLQLEITNSTKET